MNLKLLIFRAKYNGFPVYVLILLVLYLVLRLRYWHSRSLPDDGIPKSLRMYLPFNENFKFPTTILASEEIMKLTNTIELLNYEREVFQLTQFGDVHADTNMIVVQVHRDAERLQYLIVSLAQVRYIQSVLLVFSHSYYDEKINNLVLNITFCRVMQIFYPYSLQLYPDMFPGVDPEDCLSSTGNNDQYCSDRDGRLTEHKHHWWWKASFIFNNLDWSDDYKGTVIFLEEDNYVLPDLLYMLRYTTRSQVLIQGISVMSFGSPNARDLDYNQLSVGSWRPPFDKGLAFNRTVWQRLAAVTSYYCLYDDLSWSYSLLNAFSKFNEGRADMVATMAPRVVSTSMFASGRAAVRQIGLWMNDANMFPTEVKAVMLYSSSGRVDAGVKLPPWGSGGWSDSRDHLLCLDPLMATTTSDTKELTATTVPLTKVTLQDYFTITKHRVNMPLL